MERITPVELKKRLDAGAHLAILDVREPEEFAIANLGGQLIPLGDLPSRVDELPRDREIVVVCHHGVRSAHACLYLAQSGFPRVLNLSGGIDRWAAEVDPSMPRY